MPRCFQMVTFLNGGVRASWACLRKSGVQLQGLAASGFCRRSHCLLPWRLALRGNFHGRILYLYILYHTTSMAHLLSPAATRSCVMCYGLPGSPIFA